MVSLLEQMQVPNSTDLGYRRSKHPLLAIEIHEKRFQSSLAYPCPRSLDESPAALKVKHSEEQTLTYRTG